jgi:hypothetical protein
MPAAWAGEPLGQLAGDVQHPPGGQRELGPDEVAQRPPVHELHDREGQPRRLADLVDRDDVGVVEGRGRARLLGEAAQPVRDRSEGLGQELDGDVAVEVVVAGAVDLTHAPRAQLVEELVPAEPHADDGWHGVVREERSEATLRPGARRGKEKKTGATHRRARAGTRLSCRASGAAPRATRLLPRRGAWPGMPVEELFAPPVGPWAFGMEDHRRPFRPSRLPPI